MISNVNIDLAVHYRKHGRQAEPKFINEYHSITEIKPQKGSQSVAENLFDKIEISKETKTASKAPLGMAKVPGISEEELAGIKAEIAEFFSKFRVIEVNIPDLEMEYLERSFSAIKDNNLRAQAEEQGNSGGPKDETQRLTRALVAAKTRMEVQNVLSEVYKNLFPWQMAAAKGDEKAAAVVRKLNKLISRSNRKIRDLNKEDSIRLRKERAEKKEQKHLEEKARLELKRAEQERKQREKKYLHEPETGNHKSPGIPGPSLAVTEAKIRALAQQMAQISSMTGNPGAPGLDGSAVAADGGGAAADAGESVDSAAI